MVVVAAAGVVAFEPFAGGFVEVFADVRFAVPMVGLGIGLERLEIMSALEEGCGSEAKDVCQRVERLRCSEGPDRAVPLAVSDTVAAEFGVAALSGGDAEGRPEALGIDQLLPGVFGFAG